MLISTMPLWIQAQKSNYTSIYSKKSSKHNPLQQSNLPGGGYFYIWGILALKVTLLF